MFHFLKGKIRGFFRQTFPEKDHIRLQQPGTGRADRLIGQIFLRFQAHPALQTDQILQRAVKFRYIHRARPLMQAIDILRHQQPRFSRFLQLRQRIVRRIRLRLPPVIVEKFPDLRPGFLRMFQKGIDLNKRGVHFFPQTAIAAEGRDPAFHRDPRTGKDHCPCRFPQNRRCFIQILHIFPDFLHFFSVFQYKNTRSRCILQQKNRKKFRRTEK